MLECNEISSGPILELLSAFSSDLREDFYPYFPEFFSVIKDIIYHRKSTTSDLFTSLEAAEFFKDCLISSLKSMASNKLQPDALFSICKLMFSYFDVVSVSHILILLSCCDALIDLMQEKHVLHRYETAIEGHLHSVISKYPLVRVGEIVVKFVGLSSAHFNCTRLMRKVLIKSNFTDSQRIFLLRQMVRHKSFEKDFLQILAHLLIQRPSETPIDDATLDFLGHLVLVRQPPCSTPLITEPPGQMMCLSLASGLNSAEALQMTVEWILHPLVDPDAPLERKLSAALCLPHLSPVPNESVLRNIAGEVRTTFVRLMEAAPNTIEFQALAVYLLALYEAWFSYSLLSPTKSDVFMDIRFLVNTAASIKDDNVDLCIILLRVIDLTSQTKETGDLKVEDVLPFLLSFSHQVRLHALRIIRSLLSSAGASADAIGALIAVERCLSTELIKQIPNSLREFLIHVLRLHCGRSGIVGCALGAKIALHHLLGMLHVNLTPAWDAIVSAISSYANPTFYAESADSAVQPDYRGERSRKRNRKSRDRSRSPIRSEEQMDTETASSETYSQWKDTCRDLFWSVMTDLLKCPVPSDKSAVPGASVPHLVFDELPVVEAYTSLLCVIPDNEVASLVDRGDDVAPTSFSTRRPPDWKHYRLNLWRCITPIEVGKRTRLLVPLFLTFVNDEFYGTPTRSNEDVLICALKLFARMPNLHSVYKHEELAAALLRLLTNKRPAVQQAAFTCWLSLAPSGLKPYKEHFEKVLNLQTFRDAVRIFKLDTSVVSEHRRAVAQILIRILYGRLHLSKENLASAIFTNLAGCSDEELGLFLSLIIESFFSALSVDYSKRSLLFSDISASAKPNWSRLQAICNVVDQLLSYMGHRLGGIAPHLDVSANTNASVHAPALFEISLLMISTTNTIALDENEKKPHTKQVKVVRKTGVKLLLHLFSAPGIDLEAFWTPERVKLVRELVLEPHRLGTSAVASPGHMVLKLIGVWSQSGSEYLVGALFVPELLSDLVKLLQHPNLSKTVARVVIETITNLIFSPDVQETGRRILLPFHASLIDCLYSRLLALRSLSSSQARKALNSTSSEWLQREFRLLGYLAVPQSQEGVTSQADVMSTDQASRLLSGLLPFLVKALVKPASHGGNSLFVKKRKAKGRETDGLYIRRLPPSEAVEVARETTEAEVLRLLCRLMEVTDDMEAHLCKVLELFSTVESRISRALLCSAAGIAASRIAHAAQPSSILQSSLNDVASVKPGLASHLPEPVFTALRAIRAQRLEANPVSPGAAFERNALYKLLCMLNSWSTSHLEMIDAVQREAALNALLGLCDLPLHSTGDRLNYFIHLAGIHNAVYTIQTAEIQLRDLALDYILRLSRILAAGLKSDDETQKKVYGVLTKNLIIQALWPGLCRNIKQAVGPRRLHFFRLLTGLVKSFGASHRFFAPLALLADDSLTADQQPVCFYVNLQSGTSARQLFAIRRLALFLHNPLTIASKKAIARCTVKKEGDEAAPFVMPLSHLRGIFLPTLLFFIRQEMVAELSGAGSLGLESRQIVSTCLDAVRALASRLAWIPYRELLASALSNLDQESTIALKYTLAILDGYQPCEEAVDFMLTVVARLQAHIIPSYKAEGQGKSSTYLRTSAVVALVTLLRRLPKGHLESRLPHLVLRVCDLLRPSKKLPSQARHEAVLALSKVAIMVGPGQGLDSIFSTLARELSRGYAAMTIRLAALHRIFFDFTAAMDRGEVSAVHGGSGCRATLDNVCYILLRLYLDEIAGQLGEQTDSRREAFNKGSTSDFNVQTLPVPSSTDLPEARGGPKASIGLPALLRFCSQSMLGRVFTDLRTATALVAAGRIISNESLQQGGDQSTGEVKSDEKLISHLRFRKRALARLQAAINRIPTKYGVLHPKMLVPPCALGRLALTFVSTASVDTNKKPTPVLKRGLEALYRPGWGKAGTQLLEKRPDYLEVPAEPKLSTQNLHVTQTDSAHQDILSACGLQTIIGLVKLGLLSPTTRPEDATLLSDAVPLTLATLNTSKSLAVLAGAVRCVRIFFHLDLECFEAFLPDVARALFGLVDKHTGLLSTNATARDSVAQSFAHGLYAALAALIQHQTKYTLSNAQLAILFGTIEMEIVRDAATSPALSLLTAFLNRRLRDPLADDDSNKVISFDNINDSSEDTILSSGLVVAKKSDTDFSFAGAGGGRRLSRLMLRLQRMVITSSNETVRRDCRRCLLAFLLNYPHQRRFIVGFVGFLLRQLEHNREIGRASVAALLSTIVSEFPVASLLQGGLEETIILAVGAAIERETSLDVRLALYGLVRLLFTRIPAKKAVAHFNEYLLAFLRAPADTRASARLLGLQMVSVILDSQECLSVEKHRDTLLSFLGTEILTESQKQLSGLRSSHSHLFKDVIRSTEETDLVRPADITDNAGGNDDDGDWLTATDADEPTAESAAFGNLSDKEEEDLDVDEEPDGLESEPQSDHEEEKEEEEADGEEDVDVDLEPSQPEKASSEAIRVVESCINLSSSKSEPRSLRPSKSAPELHFVLVCCTLEHGLQLVDRLLSAADPQLGCSTICAPIWEALLKIEQKKKGKREVKFATLLGPAHEAMRSLLLAPTRPVREWAARVFNRLLRAEVAVCSSHGELQTPLPFASDFLAKCKDVSVRLTSLLSDALRQFEIDSSSGPMSEDYANAVLSNLVCLGQFLHALGATKQVLRIFKTANRLALDELNNRKSSFNQRILAIKLTVGLLLTLPRPSPAEISSLLARETKTRGDESSPGMLYLRCALRLLARESKQRERLAFLATSSVALPEDAEAVDGVSLSRKLSGRLSRIDSTRAKARRRRAQAKMRRALLSGELTARDAMQKLVGVPMVELSAADHLIGLIESTDATLSTKLLGGDVAGGMSSLYAWSTTSLSRKREARAARRAVRAAFGGVDKPTDNDLSTLPAKKRPRIDL
ncbi:unnamed protein product [Mesocestoides corti]|uniref:Uncharacterized protein n=3 Tax=Mesocestoides corti TaxID=53468 RepID=A0A158QVQ9_MESCO|nr:unnamed protein product [Mesocestoides corti]